jgi:hypothetical protein
MSSVSGGSSTWITLYTKPLSVQAQYRRSRPIFNSFFYNGSLVTVVCLPAAKFYPLILYFLYRGSPCRMLRTFAFSWFCVTSACWLHIHIFFLYNHECMKVRKPFTNREPVCALEIFQWCGELCFEGAAILVNGEVLQHRMPYIVSRWTYRKHFHFLAIDVHSCLERASTDPLPSNGCPIVEHSCHGNVFTEPLPSHRHMRHNTKKVRKVILWSIYSAQLIL